MQFIDLDTDLHGLKEARVSYLVTAALALIKIPYMYNSLNAMHENLRYINVLLFDNVFDKC